MAVARRKHAGIEVAEHGGDLLPLVEQDRLLVLGERDVGVGAEHGGLRRAVQMDDAGRVARLGQVGS